MYHIVLINIFLHTQLTWFQRLIGIATHGGKTTHYKQCLLSYTPPANIHKHDIKEK